MERGVPRLELTLAWVKGLMERGVPRLELTLATDWLATLEEVSWRVGEAMELLISSRTLVSVQGDTPTMIVDPRTAPFLPRAFLAMSLLWNLTCIQLALGGIECCKTVPHPENWDRTKLAAEGGNPKTVTQTSRGSRGSQVVGLYGI